MINSFSYEYHNTLMLTVQNWIIRKCVCIQNIFIFYHGLSKVENFDLTKKAEIMIIGLPTSCEIV